jgi:hypothetical protein
MLVQAAPKRILETTLLVLPNQPVTGVAEVPPASDFRARVGNLEFEVRSVTPAGASDLKTIIVFDLASIAREDQWTLLDQARTMEPGFRQMRNVSLFVVSNELTQFRTRFHQRFEFAPDQTYEYFLPETQSAAGDRGDPPLSPSQFAGSVQGGISLESFRGLAEILRSERGPIRVLWIGQNFGWVVPPHRSAHPRAGAPRQDQDVLSGKIRSYSAVAPLDAFTRSGVDFWPIVWLNGETERAKGPRFDPKPAFDIARYLGGEANLCGGNLAGCLKSVLDKSSRDAWIIRIAGPEVDWADGSAKLLNLWYAPNRAVLDLKRPFVRLDQPKEWILETNMGPKRLHTLLGTPPSVPLFDSIELSGKAGCAGRKTEKLSMTAIVPDAFVAGLRAQVEVLSSGTPGGELHIRSTPKPVFWRETGRGTAEICIALPAASQTNATYRIVVFNPEAGWAGVGFLPRGDLTIVY